LRRSEKRILAAAEPSRPQNTVYLVEVALARRDGSEAHDAKLIVAPSPEEAEPLALASAERRWPGHTPLYVVSVRVDHSVRARNYLLRLLEDRETRADEPAADPTASMAPHGHDERA
jgi:hypothetical protein